MNDEAFWTKVDRSGGPDACWPWMGARKEGGYGQRSGGASPQGAHRYSWQLANGPIPDGMVVRHRCDNPPCVNPAHLEIGTIGQNIDDMLSRGRLPMGADHHRAKLSWEQIDEARNLRTEGVTFAALGRRYGVQPDTVSKALDRKSYTASGGKRYAQAEA